MFYDAVYYRKLFFVNFIYFIVVTLMMANSTIITAENLEAMKAKAKSLEDLVVEQEFVVMSVLSESVATGVHGESVLGGKSSYTNTGYAVKTILTVKSCESDSNIPV